MSSIQIQDLMDAIETAAPPELAEPWDHCGLQFGRAEATITGAVLVLDFVPAALDLAVRTKSQLIIAHHPAIFSPLPSIRGDQPETELILSAIERGIAVYAAHTNLDAAVGGVNDALLAALGWTACRTLLPSAAAVAPDPILSSGIPDTVAPGMLRLTELDGALGRRALVRRINDVLQTTGCVVNFDTDAPVRRLAVSGGAFDADWIPVLAEHQVDFVLSGEIKYHDQLALAARGIASCAAGHDTTERLVLQPLAAWLRLRFPSVRFDVYGGLDYNNVVF